MSDSSHNFGFMGPSYNYVHHIANPTEMNLKVTGDMWEFGNNVATIGDYLAVLIAGDSRANNYPERPLGDSFFLPTVAKCTDVNSDSSNNQVQRSLYINNIPTGNIPLLSGLAGEDFSEMRGLVPGIAQNLEVLNPIAFVKQLFAGGSPPCQSVVLPTIDGSGIVTDASGYVTNVDLSILDPCAVTQAGGKWKNWTKDSLNPKVDCGDGIDKGECKCFQAFQNINPAPVTNDLFNEKILTEIYVIILGILGLYLLLKILHKSK